MRIFVAGALACALLLTTLTTRPARADAWGEYGPQCAKLDEEWKAQVVLTKKLYETMEAAAYALKTDDGKLIKKHQAKVKKTAAELLKWLKAQDKAHSSAFNGKAFHDQIIQVIDLLERKMPDIDNALYKRGVGMSTGWNQGMNAIPYGTMPTLREMVLAGSLCFYDLANPRDFVKFEDWRAIEGESL
jgi:hypothetical protein